MVKFKKVAISLGLVLVMSGSMLGSVFALKPNEKVAKTAKTSYWSSFGKDKANSTVVDAKTPISINEMQFTLNGQKEGIVAQDSIIVGDKMYVVTGRVEGWSQIFDKLSCYDLNGKLVKQVPLKSKTGFFSRICYGDGKIFVLLAEEIQAFDAETLKSLWISPKIDGQMLSTITYNDGYIYTGSTSGGGGSSAATDGKFFCISTNDENVNNELEVKDYVWVSKTGGYYWSGAVVVDGKIYFAGDSGILYSHHLTKDIVYDSYDLGGQIRSNLIFDQSTNRLIATTKETKKLITMEINNDGTFKKSSVLSTKENEIGQVTGGVSAWNGRIYVPSSNSAFCVIDAKTLKTMYKIDKLQTQSVPLVTTAYANKNNKYKVYVYAVDFKTGNLFIFEDSQEQTSYKEVAVLKSGEKISGEDYKVTTYCSSSIKTDQLGNLYFVGGSSGNGKPNNFPYALSVFKNKNAAFTKTDIENAIEILPEVNELKYSDKNLILATKKRYDDFKNTLSRANNEIKNEEKINKLYNEIILISNKAIKETENNINLISNTVSLSDENQIEKATLLYSKLFDEDKLSVKSREKLQKATDTLYEIKNSVAGLIQKIDKLPAKQDITTANKITVTELLTGYNKLNDNDKKQVTNANKLLDAVDKLKELDDILLIVPIQNEISSLVSAKNATLHNEKTVNALYKKYNSLHNNVKKMINNKSELIATYDIIQKYKKSVNEIDDLIWKTIIPTNVTLADKADIAIIKAKYNALRNSEKEFVKYYSDVIEAEKIIAQLEKEVINNENTPTKKPADKVDNPITSDTNDNFVFVLFGLAAITLFSTCLFKNKKSI